MKPTAQIGTFDQGACQMRKSGLAIARDRRIARIRPERFPMTMRFLGKNRRLQDYFLQNKDVPIDYRNPELLRRFLAPEGKILPARRTGLTAKNQRKITKAIKQARSIGLLPFTNHDA